MEEIDKPTLAAINGDAIGAGLDLRFTSDQARFAEGYVKVGIVPGDGGGYFLPRIIGLDKALEILWTGKVIDATEARAIGLITRVVPHAQLLEETYHFAEQLDKVPRKQSD